MKLPITLHQARLGSTEFTVIRPALPLAHAVLIDHDRYLGAYLDQDAAQSIGDLWKLAASSPRSLIHLPIRGNQLPSDEPRQEGPRQLDLVLLHHSLQFRPSRWKEIRGRLGPGRPRTMTLPTSVPHGEADAGHRARHHRANRDLFHQHLHAETLLMTGSARVFRETAHHFLDVAQNGPHHSSTHPNHHYCSELHSRDGVLGHAREIHIEYRDQWDPPPASPPG
ncbi:hypothetical protein [Streptomyces albipurpureus]|uniref:Uncharacterized protein n=1 Tax=Streptomyces albipurpureus TaxID=2897419 RepID=A0ABT0V0P1_9ACTN|nr:hypothetical protein [Streptomyces sp. CWNU-1]MCM2393460.1 hypothetical protein [Streptomyces sp. CWNU-1]